jgi:hypothetical protein
MLEGRAVFTRVRTYWWVFLIQRVKHEDCAIDCCSENYK